MAVLLALGAALAYGVSDFFGGLLSRRAPVFLVVLMAQVVALVLLIGVVLIWGGTISWPGLWWGLAAGVAVVGGTSMLYQGLAIGRMSVVAPISGVLGAGLPVLFGLAIGERPGLPAMIGIVTGLIAVVVITTTPEPTGHADSADPSIATSAPEAESDPGTATRTETPGTTDQVATSTRARSIGYAFGAGAGFGLFFVLLERSPADSGSWPLLGTRISMVIVLALLVAVTRTSFRPPQGMLLPLIGLGVLNLVCDLLYLLATRSGLLSLVAVVTSMYPAATIALAAIALRERIAGRLIIGLAIAAVSVGLIATG